jgi:plasmid stabilization system protein ParE
MRIVWLALAQRDLFSIDDHYREVANKAVADRVLQTIVHAAETLLDHPFLGHPSAGTDQVHELQVPRLPYLLPYRVVADRIEILRVFHAAQDRPSRWRD